MPIKTKSGRATLHGGTSPKTQPVSIRTQLVAMATHQTPYGVYDEIHWARGRFYFKPHGCPLKRITKAQAQNQFIKFFADYYEMDSERAELLVNH